jgi:hypothetical protein
MVLEGKIAILVIEGTLFSRPNYFLVIGNLQNKISLDCYFFIFHYINNFLEKTPMI